MSTSVRYAYVVNLLAVHREIDAALRELRLAIAGAELERARESMDRLDWRLRQHMQHEDELLLPEYEARVKDFPPHGSPELIRRDHGLIDEGLSRVRALLGALGPPDPGQPGRLLALCDGLSRLAHLLEHHDQREASSFQPLLDQVLPEGVRRRLLDAIAAEEEAPRFPGKSGWVGGEVYALLRLPDGAWRMDLGAGGVLDHSRAASHALVALRHGLATDAVATVRGASGALCEALPALVGAVGELTRRAPPPARLGALLGGQSKKLLALGERASAHALEASGHEEPRRRRLGFLRAYDETLALRGLLHHHDEALGELLALS
jgi:hypothetical protein